jgi:predicted nucleic acid-binding protein
VFALDANALIRALKGRGQVRRAIEGMRPSDLAVPAVVAYKLEASTLRPRNPEQHAGRPLGSPEVERKNQKH